MEESDSEFVVVGAGVLGLSAARALAVRGHQVVVCEQATVGHGTSGSKGSARIFRLGYDDPAYVRLAMTARRLWSELEAESRTTLLTTTGQVTVGDDLDVLTDAMAAAGAPYHRITPAEVKARFPALSVPTDAVYEPGSGVIAADRSLAVLGRVGAVEIRQRTSVTRLDDTGHGVRVVTRTAEKEVVLRGSAAIVCAGPWTAPLVTAGGLGLPSWPTLEQVAYLAPRDGSVDEMPVFVERRRPWFYGLPVVSEGLMKVSLHGAGPAVGLDELAGKAERGDPDPAWWPSCRRRRAAFCRDWRPSRCPPNGASMTTPPTATSCSTASDPSWWDRGRRVTGSSSHRSSVSCWPIWPPAPTSAGGSAPPPRWAVSPSAVCDRRRAAGDRRSTPRGVRRWSEPVDARRYTGAVR